VLRIIWVFLLIPVLNVMPQQLPDTAGTASYFNVINSDSTYYILSSKSILKLQLKNVNPLRFDFVDEIKGSFNSLSRLAVTESRLLVLNSDTLFLYEINPDGRLSFLFQTPDKWTISRIDPFNYDFMIRSDNRLKLLGCTTDSLFIKDSSVADYNRYGVSYPFVCSRGKIEKYSEKTGYQTVFTWEYATESVSAFQNKIAYTTWYWPDINMPPVENSLVIRNLTEPDFPLHLKFYHWGSNYRPYYPIGPSPLVNRARATKKFVKLIFSSYEEVLTLNGKNLLCWSPLPSKLEIFDDFFFKLTGTNIFVSTSDSSNLGPVIFYRNNLTGSEENIPDIADEFSLYQNYPNPFNPATVIKYSVKEYSRVSLVVYDCLGSIVSILTDELKTPGEYSTNFDGSRFPAGIYFCAMTNPAYRHVIKMILLK
jgi:hypothetical protein